MKDTVFSSRKLCPDTWLIQGDGCNSYLIVGDKRGVVIDTGFATENIQKYAQSLTDKPVKMAANTHGHFDHTGGNGWFSGAYMSAKALDIAKKPYPSLDASKYPVDYPVTVIGDGDQLELGNRILKVFEIPAHAPSSIAFLDTKEEILFTGDEVDSHAMLVWMQNEPQPSIEQHARNMEKLLTVRDDYKYICAGHEQVMGDAALVEEYLENDKRIMSGIEGEQMVMADDGPEDFVMYQIEYKRMSVYKNTAIGYDVRYILDK
ncbi:MAG: MBL fold metallo-hydrolase [Anaerolineaceae bacterium]|nr:MBL fold metallo-hydrolase [Anaerolineaceae bacterium]